MKRNHSLTLPALGSVYPYTIDGHTELFAVADILIEQGLMRLESTERTYVRETFINDVVRFVRPNDVAAWLPEMRRAYAMDAAGREALECHSGADLDCAFPSLTSALKDDLSRDRYMTIGDPVPPLVWPRQECEQSPTRSEGESAEPGLVGPMKVSDFAVGDRVLVVRKVDPDDGAAEWIDEMDVTIGQSGVVDYVGMSRVGVLFADGVPWAYAPEAIALENGCREVPKPAAPAPMPRVFKVGDTVKIARKVRRSSQGLSCAWGSHMDKTVGTVGTIEKCSLSSSDDPIPYSVGGLWYAPEALDLIEAAP